MAQALKRYLVFRGTQYDPVGGWGDFVRSFSTRYEAFDAAKRISFYDGSYDDDWGQVYDTKHRKLYEFPTQEDTDRQFRDWVTMSPYRNMLWAQSSVSE